MLMMACMMFALAMTFLFGSYVAAIAVYMLAITILIVFSGIYINPSSIPVYYQWVTWVSPFAYMFRAQFYLILFG